MVKKYLAFIIASAFSISASAQEIRLVPNNAGSLVLKNTAYDYNAAKQEVGGVLYENFSGVSKILMMQKDAPALPVFSESAIIANTGNVSLEVTYDSYIEIDDISVLPSKGSLKRNVNPSAIAFQMGAAYTENAFFPGTLAQAGSPYIFRKTRGVTVSFYPYQYNPVTKKLRIYKNISAKIITDDQPGINSRLAAAAPENTFFDAAYRNHYANMPAYSPIADQGELLIVTPEEYINTITPLVNWKIAEGMKTTVATLEEAGQDDISIKEYINDFYVSNPNLAYVILVGDHENLPSHTYGFTGEELWSDSFYGQLEGEDLYPELMVGRFSGSVTDVETMVVRTLEYETNPLSGDWMTHAIGIGSNEGNGIGDDNEPDWEHLRNIGSRFSDFGYASIYEFYDGSHGGNDLPGSPTSASISNAINSGAGILNYTGHGAYDVMVTGDYDLNDVATLANPGKYPFVISVACNNGTFIDETSLCEAFMNKTHNDLPAGSIATCGSSILMAWAEPMQTQDEMAELIVRSDMENMKTTLGGLFYNGQISMLEAYGSSYTAEEVMQTWVFFGDPTVLFRSQITTDITAVHEPEIGKNGGALNIASNTEGAKIAIVQDNTIVATGEISGGEATIEIPALATMNALTVTLTKQNTKPYLGEVTVMPSLGVYNPSQLFAVYPNPASDFIHIESNGNLGEAAIRIADMNGRLLLDEKQVNLSSVHTVSTSAFASGMYLLSIQASGKTKTEKIIIR